MFLCFVKHIKYSIPEYFIGENGMILGICKSDFFILVFLNANFITTIFKATTEVVAFLFTQIPFRLFTSCLPAITIYTQFDKNQVKPLGILFIFIKKLIL